MRGVTEDDLRTLCLRPDVRWAVAPATIIRHFQRCGLEAERASDTDGIAHVWRLWLNGIVVEVSEPNLQAAFKEKTGTNKAAEEEAAEESEAAAAASVAAAVAAAGKGGKGKGVKRGRSPAAGGAPPLPLPAAPKKIAKKARTCKARPAPASPAASPPATPTVAELGLGVGLDVGTGAGTGVDAFPASSFTFDGSAFGTGGSEELLASAETAPPHDLPEDMDVGVDAAAGGGSDGGGGGGSVGLPASAGHYFGQALFSDELARDLSGGCHELFMEYSVEEFVELCRTAAAASPAPARDHEQGLN